MEPRPLLCSVFCRAGEEQRLRRIRSTGPFGPVLSRAIPITVAIRFAFVSSARPAPWRSQRSWRHRWRHSRPFVPRAPLGPRGSRRRRRLGSQCGTRVGPAVPSVRRPSLLHRCGRRCSVITWPRRSRSPDAPREAGAVRQATQTFESSRRNMTRNSRPPRKLLVRPAVCSALVGTRTPNLLIRSQMLYPIELRALECHECRRPLSLPHLAFEMVSALWRLP